MAEAQPTEGTDGDGDPATRDIAWRVASVLSHAFAIERSAALTLSANSSFLVSVLVPLAAEAATICCSTLLAVYRAPDRVDDRMLLACAYLLSYYLVPRLLIEAVGASTVQLTSPGSFFLMLFLIVGIGAMATSTDRLIQTNMWWKMLPLTCIMLLLLSIAALRESSTRANIRTRSKASTRRATNDNGRLELYVTLIVVGFGLAAAVAPLLQDAHHNVLVGVLATFTFLLACGVIRVGAQIIATY